jgi:hypothetical protein
VAVTGVARRRRNTYAKNERRYRAGDFDAIERQLILQACFHYEMLIATVNAFPNTAEEIAMIKQSWGWVCSEAKLNLALDNVKIQLVCFCLRDGHVLMLIYRYHAGVLQCVVELSLLQPHLLPASTVLRDQRLGQVQDRLLYRTMCRPFCRDMPMHMK